MCIQYYPDDPRSQESIDKKRDVYGNLSGNAVAEIASSFSAANFSKSDVPYVNALSGNEAAQVSDQMKS